MGELVRPEAPPKPAARPAQARPAAPKPAAPKPAPPKPAAPKPAVAKPAPPRPAPPRRAREAEAAVPAAKSEGSWTRALLGILNEARGDARATRVILQRLEEQIRRLDRRMMAVEEWRKEEAVRQRQHDMRMERVARILDGVAEALSLLDVKATSPARKRG
ncbi:MAG: hypothetical protein HYZ53_11925 [Planctomycetes bacterium]|nr:hypothetical protein [Planctomycetota bacterium]